MQTAKKTIKSYVDASNSLAAVLSLGSQQRYTQPLENAAAPKKTQREQRSDRVSAHGVIFFAKKGVGFVGGHNVERLLQGPPSIAGCCFCCYLVTASCMLSVRGALLLLSSS